MENNFFCSHPSPQNAGNHNSKGSTPLDNLPVEALSHSLCFGVLEKTLHLSSKVFVEHAWHVAQI